MSLETWKKVQRKLSHSKILNKTLALRRQIRKTSRRKCKHCGNGCRYTNMAYTDTDMHMTSSRHHIAKGFRKITKPKPTCKTSVNNKSRQTFIQVCVNKLNKKKFKEKSDNNVKHGQKNTISSKSNWLRERKNNLTYLSTNTNRKQTKLTPFKMVSLGPRNSCDVYENSRTVKLNIIKNKQRIWRHNSYNSNKLGKILKIAVRRNSNSTETAVTRNKSTTGIQRNAENMESISRVSVPIANNPITKVGGTTTTTPLSFPSETVVSRSSGSPSSYYSTLWPFSTSCFFWSRKRRHRSNSTSSWNTSPILRNSMFRGILMTILVFISICHNGVPETSAASIMESGKLSPSPQLLPTTLAATFGIATTPKSHISMVPIEHQHKELSTNRTQQQNSLNASSLPQEILYNINITDEKLEDTTTGTLRKPQVAGQTLLLPAKQKRGPQLPPSLTSIQETSSSRNRLAHDIMYRKTLESLSIADGGLMLPIDVLRQAQRDKEQQHRSDYENSKNSISNGDLSIEMTSQQKRHTMPVFDFGLPQNITARTGHMEAAIKCRVDRIGDKSVSWIRKRDLHILSVGKTTYTSDKRYLVTESKDAREWTLHIRTPQARDSGIYECQVNTEPKMSMAFQVNIIEISPNANAVITGPTDLYVKVGSVITLTCLVRQPSIKDIGPIHWYRSEHLLTPFAANDAKIQENYFVTAAALTSKSNSVDHPHSDTDMYDSNADEDENVSQNIKDEITQDFQQRVAMEQQLCDTIKSRLRISNAQKSDSGNYTCQPTTASSASVVVHVINEENPAAMQKSGAASRSHL